MPRKKLAGCAGSWRLYNHDTVTGMVIPCYHLTGRTQCSVMILDVAGDVVGQNVVLVM